MFRVIFFFFFLFFSVTFIGIRICINMRGLSIILLLRKAFLRSFKIVNVTVAIQKAGILIFNESDSEKQKISRYFNEDLIHLSNRNELSMSIQPHSTLTMIFRCTSKMAIFPEKFTMQREVRVNGTKKRGKTMTHRYCLFATSVEKGVACSNRRNK